LPCCVQLSPAGGLACAGAQSAKIKEANDVMMATRIDRRFMATPW